MVHKISKIILVAVLFVHVLSAQTVIQRNNQNLRRTAEAFERAGQYQNAADYYSRAVLVNPKDVAAYLGARRTLDQLGTYDQLEKLLLQLQSKHRDLRYSVDLAWIQYQLGHEDRAERAWNQIIEENSTRQDTYSLIGKIYVENQLYEDAVDLYLVGRQNIKNDRAFMYELAQIYHILNEQAKLANEYIHYIAAYPQQLDFLSRELQRFVQTQENVNPLIKTLEKSLKSEKTPHWAIHLFLSDTYMMKQDYENALLHCVELERSLAASDMQKKIRAYAKGKYLHEFANSALDADAIEHAENAFTILIKEFDDSRYVASAKIGLARVYKSQQQYEKALDALQLFVDQNKRSADTRLALMQMGDIAYYQLFDVGRAETAYTRALKEYPNVNFRVETRLRLADCAIARNDLHAAESHLQRALQISEADPALNAAALMHLARLEFYRTRPSTCMNYLDDLSNIVFPSNQTNDFDNDAIELTMLLQDNQYDSTGLAHLGQARLLIHQRQYQQAGELLNVYLLQNPNSPLRSELRLLLADVYRTLSKFEPAAVLLDSVYSDSTSFYRDAALLTAAELYENELSDPVLAQERYEKILIEFPMSIYLETARERLRKLENQE